MLNHKECQCCGIQEMESIGHFGKYEQLACNECGYVRFVHDSYEVNHTLYETDDDYNDDLSVANDFEDFLQWNHNNAMQYLNTKYPGGNVSVLDVGCFTGFFVKKLPIFWYFFSYSLRFSASVLLIRFTFMFSQSVATEMLSFRTSTILSKG